jgi:transglutaminase-like putative cysteine protease
MMTALARLPRLGQHLVWVIGGLLLALVPHFADLHLWIVMLVLVAVAVRLTIELRQWRLPPRLVRIAIAVAAMLGVLATYRTLNGLEAGTALLALMGAMKLFETQNRRDLTVLVFVAYMLLFAGFLYNQSLLRLPWMLVTAWLLTAALMRVHQTNAISVREALSLTGKMVVQALPLAILLFLFFPRLPGQFWSVPPRGGATTGIDDEMSPGDISELSQSSAIAFRVRFEGEMPPPGERYWRGPVMHQFDGRTWRRLQRPLLPQPIIASGPTYRYDISLEPNNQEWIFGLDAVTEWSDRRVRQRFDRELLASYRMSVLSTFSLESRTQYRSEEPLPITTREADTSLTEHNPRSKALAQEIYARTGNPSAFVDAVLRKFRDEQYYYTLEPPRLEMHSVDDFLFSTKQGFCEHFASAFTMLARAAGIPARVVTGYQGGEFNPIGGYLAVRQSDAHAWSEVWIDGQGWVRVDPTAAVAPERVQRGMAAALGENEPVPDRLLNDVDALVKLRQGWDALNTFWNDQIVEFGEEQQRSVLDWLGFADGDWEMLGTALVISLAGFFVVLTSWLAWQYRPRKRDPVAQAYDQLCHRLAGRQLGRAAHEGPQDYLSRVAVARPDLHDGIDEIRSLYLSLRYGPTPLDSQLSRLKFLVSQLKV